FAIHGSLLGRPALPLGCDDTAKGLCNASHGAKPDIGMRMLCAQSGSRSSRCRSLLRSNCHLSTSLAVFTVLEILIAQREVCWRDHDATARSHASSPHLLGPPLSQFAE